MYYPTVNHLTIFTLGRTCTGACGFRLERYLGFLGVGCIARNTARGAPLSELVVIVRLNAIALVLLLLLPCPHHRHHMKVHVSARVLRV